MPRTDPDTSLPEETADDGFSGCGRWLERDAQFLAQEAHRELSAEGLVVTRRKLSVKVERMQAFAARGVDARRRMVKRAREIVGADADPAKRARALATLDWIVEEAQGAKGTVN